MQMRIALILALILSSATTYAQGLRLPGAAKDGGARTPSSNATPSSAPSAGPSAARESLEVDRVVAVVNNEVITLHELRSKILIVVAGLRKQGTPLPPQDVIERQMLERMIVERAQLQLARDSSLRVDDAQLERSLTRIAEGNKLSVAQFKAAVEKDGIPFSRFREDIRTEMVLGRLREREVDTRITVTDAEVEHFLSSPMGAAGASAEEFDVAHILLRVPEAARPEQLQRVRAKADKIIADLRGGADFAQLAAANSDAPDALQGGHLGYRTRDRMPSLFAEIIAVMKPGQVSDALKSANGYHIVKLVGRRGGQVTTTQLQQTRARHILIKTNEVVSEAEGKRKLELVRERIAHGAKFEEMARLHSQDTGSAIKGGEMGFANPGDFVPEFEKTMNELKIGELSQPVKSQFGWHLIQVLERRTHDATDERRKLMARQALFQRKAEEAYDDWIRQLRDQAYVEIKLEER